jgi:hypothetical protein
MRLKSFINESDDKITDYDSLVDTIRKNCNQYIKEVNNGNGHMFLRELRGSSADKSFGKIQSTRSGRNPIDSDIEGHKILDDFFYKKYKIRGRSETWFAWIKKIYKINMNYSHSRLLFPYNGYKYLWNPEIRDLIIGDEKNAKKFIRKFGKKYKTKDALKISGEGIFEVMIKASKCVLVNSKIIEDKQKFFDDIGITSIKVE